MNWKLFLNPARPPYLHTNSEAKTMFTSQQEVLDSRREKQNHTRHPAINQTTTKQNKNKNKNRRRRKQNRKESLYDAGNQTPPVPAIHRAEDTFVSFGRGSTTHGDSS
jgi:hypothetical protein